jgi:hypothetical protein
MSVKTLIIFHIYEITILYLPFVSMTESVRFHVHAIISIYNDQVNKLKYVLRKGLLFCRVPQTFLALLILKRL